MSFYGTGSFEFAHEQAATRSFDFRSTVVVVQSPDNEDVYHTYDDWSNNIDEERIVAVYINGMRFQRVNPI